MCEKTLFTLFFTVHMPWCTVHVAGLKKKKKNKKTKQNKTLSGKCGSKPNQSIHNIINGTYL